tara:strand:+ start:579 stop:2159 length:1581 start_codon:yes stop_codon:yes gene_type:complete
MARQTINIGTNANDGTGDPLRTAFDKINDNFAELYVDSDASTVLEHDTAPKLAGNLDTNGQTITTDVTNGNVTVNANGTGIISLTSDTTVTGNMTVTGKIFLGDTATDITQVTGIFEADQIQINGSTISGLTTNGDVTIAPNGTGAVVLSGATTISGAVTATSLTTNTIVSNGSNADLSIQPSGSGSVTVSGLQIQGTTLSSSDSTILNINENLIVDGTITSAGALSSTSGAFSTTLSVTGATTLTGTATIAGGIVTDDITSPSNADISIQPGGTGNVVLGAVTVNGTTISSADSTNLNLNENTIIDGTLAVSGATEVSGVLTTVGVNTTGTITVAGQLDVDGVRIKDNTITTNASNSVLEISANGTGTIDVQNQMSTLGQTVTGDLVVSGQADIDNLELNGNTISAKNTNGGITISPQGTGQITLNGNYVGVTNTISTNDIEVANEMLLASGAKIVQIATNSDLILSTNGTGTLQIDNPQTQTTVGTNGSASAPPSKPVGFIKLKLNLGDSSGLTTYVVPFYHAS